MSDPIIEQILEGAIQDLRRRLEEAFVAGGDKVRRELMAVLSPVSNQPVAVPHSPPERSNVRATPGTVKPTIVGMIEGATNNRKGISTSEIIDLTGFKENSVRGTLSTLRSEGKIESRGDRWFLNETSSPRALEEDDGI